MRKGKWRYIRYADGSEELYDHKLDPNEWANVANNPEHAAIMRRLASFLPDPDSEAKNAPTDSTLKKSGNKQKRKS